MMRERYSCRKSIWRWLIMVIPPPAGKARGDLGWLIYHTSITLRSPCSIDPAAAGGSRHSADNARHDRVLGGRFRLARKNDLATLDHVEPVGEIRHVMDVGLGNEQCMAEGADAGEVLDDRRHDHRREPFGGLIQQEQFWAERERARDRHHLALDAGQRMTAARAVALERGEHTVSLLDPRCCRSRLRVHPSRQGDVFRNRQLPEYLALLRREGDAEARDLVRPQPHEVDAVKGDRAGRWLAKAHDGAERRGLACTVATDQVHQLARLDLERDTVQHAAALHVDAQVLRAQHQCLLRLPITFSMSCGSAKNRSGGKSASTRPCESAMMRCE